MAIDAAVGDADVEHVLSVRLLGGTEVRRRGELVDGFGPGRLQSLVGFLVVHRERAVPRQQLAFTFWPDSTDGQARTNLRQLLHHLRRALPELDSLVRLDPTWVQWRADAAANVDLVSFETLANRALAASSVELLAEALACYRGELLVGNYDEWVDAPRARLVRLAVTVVASLVEHSTKGRDGEGVIAALERWLELDPLDESVYRHLMTAHLQRGDRLRALRAFHACSGVLERELGVGPDPSTLAVHRAVLASAQTAQQGPLSTSPGAARLVGRVNEVERLAGALRSARAGGPAVVVLTGEAGVGKSRVAAEVAGWAVPSEVVVLFARGYEAEGNVPYGPVVEMLRAEPALRAIAALAPVPRAQLARLMPELGPSGEAGAFHAEGSGEARRLLYEAVGQAFWAAARTVVVVLDDLQWCDDATLEVVEHLVRDAERRRIAFVLVATARREDLVLQPRLRAFLARLHRLGVVDEIALERLALDDARRLSASLFEPDVDETIAALIAQTSEGNPLFIVELARAVGSAAPGKDTVDLGLTPRLRAVIAQRLAGLSPDAAATVGVASAIGRAFDVELLARCVTADVDLVGALDELWVRGIVRHVGGDRYDFTHDKLREVAHTELPPARFREVHHAIATALADLPSGRTDESAAAIAAHFLHAGLTEEALTYLRRAAEVAARRLAYGDVIVHCRSGLALFADLADGPGRDAQELGFLVPLGVALLAGPGITVDDLAVFERARELNRRLGRPDDPSTLRVLANALIPRRRFAAARQLGEELLARVDEDVLLATEGHYLLGVTSFWLAEIPRSQRHLRLALESYQPGRRHEHLERFAQDPGAVCLSRLALTEAHLGHASLARQLVARAASAARDSGHAYTEIYIGLSGGWTLAELGDVEAGASLALGSISAPDHLVGRASHTLFTGWAHLAAGDIARAIAALHVAIDVIRDGALMYEPLALLLQAEAYLRNGDLDTGIPIARRALGIATNEMPFHLPEANRLLGELELAAGTVHPGLDRLRRAATTAEAHGNLLHALRAHLSIVRATPQLDLHVSVAARSELADWYQRHAVGCDLPELDLVRAFLDEPATTERP